MLQRQQGRTLTRAELLVFANQLWPTVQTARTVSADLAAEFYSSARRPYASTKLQLPQQRLYSPDMLARGIDAVGRGTLTIGEPGSDTLLVKTAVRHARMAGMDRVTDSVRLDKVAQGWARMHTGPKEPCAFCRVLISRGPTYSAESVRFSAHNGCSCVPTVFWRGEETWPGYEQTKKYREQYYRYTKGVSGTRKTLQAFRAGVTAHG